MIINDYAVPYKREKLAVAPAARGVQCAVCQL